MKKGESTGPQHIEFIHKAIHEFLLKNGYFNTLDSFQQELAANKGKPDHSQAAAAVVHALSSGDAKKYFKLWARYLPSNVRSTLESQRLEFYSHVLFAIFPLHPIKRGQRLIEDSDIAEFKKSIEEFKEFLNTKGAELSRSEEFLHFYALPYIPSPMEHPSFKMLFTRNWVNELKDKILKFLKNNSPSPSQPMLLQMYKAYAGLKKDSKKGQSGGKQLLKENESSMHDYEEQISQLMNQIDELERENKNYKVQIMTVHQREEYARSALLESQTKWNNLAKDILYMTKELYRSLESIKRGQAINEPLINAIAERIVKYDSFLNMTSDEISANASFTNSYIDRSVSDFSPSPIKPSSSPVVDNRKLTKGHSSLPALNYARVIKDLSLLQDEVALCALLQALRWRLTRSQTVLRKEVLAAYIKYNILCTSKPHDTLLDKLLSSSKRIKEYTVRLLNVIASECSGRTYLLTKENLIQAMSNILYEEKEDSPLRKNSLGTLQKLSLRRQAQSSMIELNMIEWLGNLLKHEADSISYYSLEYGTALLMNLSLRTAGKDKIETCSVDILSVLNNLLEHENIQVRTYVNGTLYSILTRQQLKEHAFELGMDEALRFLMHQSDEHLKRQIQYILDQLNSEQEDCLSDDNDDDPEDRDEDESEIDDYIAEDEDMEDVMSEQNILTGEELLQHSYMAKSDMNKSLESDRPFSRPITPGKTVEKEQPSELLSRPKIPRTPDEPFRPINLNSKASNKSLLLPLEEEKEESKVVYSVPKVNSDKVVNTPIPSVKNEADEIFLSRDKIPRSPL